MSSQPPPLSSETGLRRFGTFEGVLRPIVLTTLGAMLYLREGWLVGNCGLLGALAIILGAYLITGTTALSVSSVATNVRVRPGGAFAIIAQSLGLEAGGAIGIPLYLAQTASAAMYLYAFSEAWAYLFPGHSPTLVVCVAFSVVALLAWRSAFLAFRAQSILLWVVGIALTSALLGVANHQVHAPDWVGSFSQATYREAFAIFFPAATGIMVGVGMSGSLQDPRASIPRGVLGAWGITLGLYVVAAFWYSMIAEPSVLMADKTVMVRNALLPPIVLVGLLCSSAMAALSSLVAAPRLLHAMAEQRVVPRGAWFARSTEGGEPHHASLVTTILAGVFLLSGSLDAIAPIVTSFFIVTYLALNLVVWLEQRLAMISFRPTFEIPTSVPLFGVGVCMVGLMICSPAFGLVELVLAGLLYAWLQGRQLHTPWETVRSGITVSIATWAAHRAADMTRSERAWQPDFLVPVHDPVEAEQLGGLLETLTLRNGSARWVGTQGGEELAMTLESLRARLRRNGAYSTSMTLDAGSHLAGTRLAMEATLGSLFAPNLLVIHGDRHNQRTLQQVLDHGRLRGLGLALFFPHPNGEVGPAREISVWLSDRSPDWRLRLHNANLDLPVLLGYLLASPAEHRLRLRTVVNDSTHLPDARDFLHRLLDMGRMPPQTQVEALEGDFLEVVRGVSHADLHLFGLAETVDLKRTRAICRAAGASCLFVQDSGFESVLA